MNETLIPLGNPTTGITRQAYNAGHLIGLQYGGPDSVFNLVPQKLQLNQTRVTPSGSTQGWRSKDDQIKSCLDSSCTQSASITVSVSYDNSDNLSNIPSAFDVTVMFTPKSGKKGGPMIHYLNAADTRNFKPQSNCFTQWQPVTK